MDGEPSAEERPGLVRLLEFYASLRFGIPSTLSPKSRSLERLKIRVLASGSRVLCLSKVRDSRLNGPRDKGLGNFGYLLELDASVRDHIEKRTAQAAVMTSVKYRRATPRFDTPPTERTSRSDIESQPLLTE